VPELDNRSIAGASPCTSPSFSNSRKWKGNRPRTNGSCSVGQVDFLSSGAINDDSQVPSRRCHSEYRLDPTDLSPKRFPGASFPGSSFLCLCLVPCPWMLLSKQGLMSRPPYFGSLCGGAGAKQAIAHGDQFESWARSTHLLGPCVLACSSPFVATHRVHKLPVTGGHLAS
jgi:hypothetical protein